MCVIDKVYIFLIFNLKGWSIVGLKIWNLKLLKYFSYLAIVACVSTAFAFNKSVNAQEIELGVTELNNGVELIFEAAHSDTIIPAVQNMPVSNADIHLEVRANLEASNIFGAANGGFLPYLNVNVLIVNKRTGDSVQTILLPHINLIDGFHYARNVDLPGNPAKRKRELYDLTFWVNPPDKGVVSISSDLNEALGSNEIVEKTEVKFTDVSFSSLVVANPGGGEPNPTSTPRVIPTPDDEPDPTPTPTPDDGPSNPDDNPDDGDGGGGGSGSGSGSGGGGSGGGDGNLEGSSLDNEGSSEKKSLRLFF